MRCISFAFALLVSSLAFAETSKVVVLPFANVDTDMMAKAVQASMIADLSRGAGISAEGGPANSDLTQAVQSAQTRKARFLVAGGYQTMDGEVRFTGQVIDLKTGTVVGGLKATGPMRDLFGLEDALGRQAQQAILATLNPAPPPAPQPAGAMPPAPQPTFVRAPVVPYSFEGSDLERSLNAGITPSVLYDNYSRSRYNYYYGDQYDYYFGNVFYPVRYYSCYCNPYLVQSTSLRYRTYPGRIIRF